MATKTATAFTTPATDPTWGCVKIDDSSILRTFNPGIELQVISRLMNKDGTLKRPDFILSEDQAPRIVLLSINGQTREAEIEWNGHHHYKPINADGQIQIYKNLLEDANILHFCQVCLIGS